MVDTVIKQQQDSASEVNDYCLQTFTTVSNVFNFKSIKTLMQVCILIELSSINKVSVV